MTENNEEKSEKDISTQWLNEIYESLRRIRDMERLMREGCNDILEYVNLVGQHQEAALVEVQLKNMSLLLSELDMFIGIIKVILPSEQYKSFKTKIKINSQSFNQGITQSSKEVILPYQIIFNQPKKQQQRILTKLFYIISTNLSQLISDLISDTPLNKMLFRLDDLQHKKFGEV